MMSTYDNQAIMDLRNNEMLYDGLLGMERAGTLPESLRPTADAEASIYERTAEAALAISDDLKSKGLRFFFMKTFRTYPYTDHDMDLVIADIIKKPEYIKALEGAGYEVQHDRSSLREPGKKFYRDLRDASAPKVHLHDRVTWNGVTFLDAASVWKRLRKIDVKGGKIESPSIEDEILILAAHAIFENSYLTLGELRHLKKTLRSAKGLDTHYMASASQAYNWNAALKYCLACAELCHERVFSGRLFDENTAAALDLPALPFRVDARLMPFFMPPGFLLKVYADKFFRDIFKLRLRELPRQALNYVLVMWLMRSRKRAAFRKEI
jgi:hypothetical protein